MTTYEPYPVVTFNENKTYADKTISTIFISNGRNDVTEQPQPGYASIRLITDADTPINIELAQSVAVSIDKGTSGTQTIFNGTISDIEITLDEFGNQGNIASYVITAVGPLSQLNRRSVANGYNYDQQFDGIRVYKILSDAFATLWQNVQDTTTWANINNNYQWNTFDATQNVYSSTLLANIDRPGQYELAAYILGESNALQLADLAATSGRGVLYESGTGEIFYDDYLARINATILTLTDNDLLAKGLKTNAQWGEIVNQASIVYAGGTKTSIDGESVQTFGQLSGSRSTQLIDPAAASAQAKDFVKQRSYPRMYPEALTIALHSPSVTDAKRDALCAVINGLRVKTTALPAVFGTSFDGFVEGYTWNLTRYTADLTLICSAYSETYSNIVWAQILPITTWTGYTPSTDKWMDL